MEVAEVQKLNYLDAGFKQLRWEIGILRCRKLNHIVHNCRFRSGEV